jgi:hypothetical protein
VVLNQYGDLLPVTDFTKPRPRQMANKKKKQKISPIEFTSETVMIIKN